MAPYIQKLTPGSRSKYLELETKLLDWFKESRSQLKVITRCMIQAKAHSFANRAVYQDIYTNINVAKFSQKWVDSFMTRHNLVNRRKSQLLNGFLMIMLSYKTVFYFIYFTKEKKINIRYR